MTPNLVNLGFYRFYQIGDLVALRELRVRLQAICAELQMKGTILIAPEGINAMVSASLASIEAFKDFAREHLGIENPAFKQVHVPNHSFRRMLIKIKKEIIPVGDPTLQPCKQTGKRLTPQELKQWIDEHRPMVLLDTRNHYEVEVGSFKGALDLGLESSRDFSTQASKHLNKWKELPVVTFCTGGIRCEKSTALLLKLGLTEVYQLDGGILRYFEECGPTHFEGQCFVFDWRLAVNGELKPVPRSEDSEREFGRHRQP
jgi:UPF0176 protein